MQLNDSLRVFIEKPWTCSGEYKLFLTKEGKVMLQDGTWAEHEPGCLAPAGAGIRLPEGSLQKIIDALIDFGVVPTKYKETTKEVSAIKYHLEDMRKIVFKNYA